jgi:GT2 family glycosyltransferase
MLLEEFSTDKAQQDSPTQSRMEVSAREELGSFQALQQPSVSIIIVHHHGVKILANCLKSVYGTRYRNLQVVLVDNGSKDGSVDLVKKVYGDCLDVIHSEANLGFVGGNNLASSRVRSKYVVLLNDDTVATPDWLEKLVDVAERDPSVGACQPKLLSLVDPEYFEFNGCSGGMLDVFGVPFCRGRIFDVIEKDEGQYDGLAEVFWAGGAAILIRRSLLDEVGLLDDLFYAHMEEIDLCWRIRLGGYKVMAVPSSVVYHLGGSTPIAGKFYLKQRNNLIVLLKNYSFPSLVRFFPGRVVLDALSFFYFVLKHDGDRCVSILKAYLSLLRMFGKVVNSRQRVQARRKIGDAAVLKAMFGKSVAIQHYLMNRKSFDQIDTSRAR